MDFDPEGSERPFSSALHSGFMRHQLCRNINCGGELSLNDTGHNLSSLSKRLGVSFNCRNALVTSQKQKPKSTVPLPAASPAEEERGGGGWWPCVGEWFIIIECQMLGCRHCWGFDHPVGRTFRYSSVMRVTYYIVYDIV